MTAGATGAWEPDIGTHAVAAPAAWRSRRDGHTTTACAALFQRAPSGAIVIPHEAGLRENAARFAPHASLRDVDAHVMASVRANAWSPPRSPRRRVIAAPDHSDEHLPLPPDSTASQTTRRRIAANRTAVAVEEPIA